MLNKTTFGYELRACGYNRNAAKYAGMNEKRNILLSMAIAGGLAACGASLWCLNGQQDFKWNTYQALPNVGFNGIPAALLASNNPIGVIFSAIFLRYIDTGGSYLPGETSFNEYVSQLIIAVIIYFAGFSKFINDYLKNKQMKKVNAPTIAGDYVKIPDKPITGTKEEPDEESDPVPPASAGTESPELAWESTDKPDGTDERKDGDGQ